MAIFNSYVKLPEGIHICPSTIGYELPHHLKHSQGQGCLAGDGFHPIQRFHSGNPPSLVALLCAK